MVNISKRKKIINKNIEKNKKYKLNEAIEILKKTTLVKFCETVEIVINLGKNANKENILKKGKINYCVDKNGIINTVIGKIKFSIKEIKKTFNVLIKDLLKKKSVKDIKKIYISTTMGPGLIIDKREYIKIIK